MKTLLAALLILGTCANAQTGLVGQFAVWKPKEGKEDLFEAGYKKHLEWHRTNGDTWDWYGWFFSSGPRTGTFVDATLFRSWAELDHPVKPAEDWADNRIHTVPFANLETVFRVAYMPGLSIQDGGSLRSKYLCMVTLEALDVFLLRKLLDKMVTPGNNMPALKTHLVFQVVDGGSMNQWLVFLGADSMEAYGRVLTEWMNRITLNELFKKAVATITAERLTYREDLSLLTGKRTNE